MSQSTASIVLSFNPLFSRLKSNVITDGEKYVLSWVGRQRMMHGIVKVEGGVYWINRTRFPSFPALVEHYMCKPATDSFHLAMGLQNSTMWNVE